MGHMAPERLSEPLPTPTAALSSLESDGPGASQGSSWPAAETREDRRPGMTGPLDTGQGMSKTLPASVTSKGSHGQAVSLQGLAAQLKGQVPS